MARLASFNLGGKPLYFIPVVAEGKHIIIVDYLLAVKGDQRLVKQRHSFLGMGTNYVRKLINLALTDKVLYRCISQHNLDSSYPARAISFRHEGLTLTAKEQRGHPCLDQVAFMRRE